MKNVDQTSQASPDQTLADPPQIVNPTKTPDTKGKDTSPDSPLLLNNILTPDTKTKQTTSFSNSFQESFFSLKAELFELKISLKNEIGELRNSIRDIKAKKDVHSEKANENKRLWDELENKNTIIKSLIDNFPPSENLELVSENFQNTDALHYREMIKNYVETEMYLILKILEARDLQ